METLFQQILNILIEPPGNVIYHLVLAFSIISALQAVLITRQISAYPHTGRMIFGLTMILLGQAVLFLSSSLAWQAIVDEHYLLPPLDRAVLLYSVIWIVWLWNFPAPARLGDLVTGFLNLGVVLLFLFTYTSWTAEGAGNVPFNTHWTDWTWELAAAVVVLTGMGILLFTRPEGWSYGIGMLSLSLAGFVGHLLLTPASGDFSGIIRLSQLAAFPLLPTLLNRMSLPKTRSAASDQSIAEPAPIPFPRAQERRRYSTDPRTVRAWLELSRAEEPEKIISGLSRALAQTMLSDLCFLVTGPNYGHLVLQSGYDLIREEELQGTMLEQSQVPALSNALARGKPLRITVSDSQPPDLKTLSTSLGLSETGSMMFIPLVVNEKPQGGILFLSPYSSRQWNTDDQSFLSSELELIAQAFMKAQRQAESQAFSTPASSTTAGVEQASNELRLEIEALRQENQRLLDEVNQIQHSNGRNGTGASTEVSALVALQQEAQEQIASLQAENERLQAALRGQGISVLSPDEFKRMESELRSTLQEIALLQNQLAEANARNLMLERDLRAAGRASNVTEDQQVLASIAQEFRQPMSSILGYTDLLLAESVGILGAMQRKFLDRIKASTERMRSMLDDLIRLATLENDLADLQKEPVDFASIVDNAVSVTSAQLREKDIAMRVDLQQEMPPIYSNREAIQQIIVHLLQNAGAATPSEGTIILRARMQKENGEDYLWLQVTDTGGGIETAELQRVFARRFQADQPLIKGLGDTSVGLSIAKALVEAHGGRIWADSVMGESTTFSVLMPFHPSETDTAQE